MQNWADSREPSGEVYSGEVGCILDRDSNLVVGIDVAWITAEHADRQLASATRMIDGPPALAVEILAESDKHADISSKVDDYLNSDVQLVWIIDPHFHTVVVHRPGRKPELFNDDQRLTGDDVLPGFDVAVSELFA